MKCVNDIELMEFISGMLADTHREIVQKHIEKCPECSLRFQEAVKLWEMLGRWNVETANHNIADRAVTSIKELAPDRGRGKRIPLIKTGFWRDVLRVAASAIITISLGQKLGEISAGHKSVPADSSQTGPKYIAALGLEWSSELAWLMMEEQAPEQE